MLHFQQTIAFPRQYKQKPPTNEIIKNEKNQVIYLLHLFISCHSRSLYILVHESLHYKNTKQGLKEKHVNKTIKQYIIETKLIEKLSRSRDSALIHAFSRCGVGGDSEIVCWENGTNSYPPN